MIGSTIINSILFEKYTEFTTNFSEDFPVCIDTNKHTVPEILKQYEYPVSSWPVIISAERVSELKQLVVTLPKLIRQLPSLYFNNDIKRIANFYFGGDETLTQFALVCHNKNIEIGCRLDLTLTDEGFRVLEANMGSSIGGWQIQSFESIIKELHTSLTDTETADNFESRNTQLIYINFLIEKIREYVRLVDKEINIFIGVGEMENTALKKNILTFFNDLLKQESKKQNLIGRAYAGSISSLQLGNNGELFFDNQRIHGIVTFDGEQEKVTPSVFRSFIMDKVYLPDHVGVPMLGDKRNLALLRELAERAVFSPEENALILKYVPWTSIIDDRNVVFRNTEYNLLELIRDKREQLVIKAANGFQGKNVFVGKFLTPKEWEMALEQALGKHAFVVQELSESLDFLAPNHLNKWVPHKLIWGAFGFGKTYGGVWVRMSVAKSDLGVINSATGAIEAIVYETRC